MKVWVLEHSKRKNAQEPIASNRILGVVVQPPCYPSTWMTVFIPETNKNAKVHTCTAPPLRFSSRSLPRS